MDITRHEMYIKFTTRGQHHKSKDGGRQQTLLDRIQRRVAVLLYFCGETKLHTSPSYAVIKPRTLHVAKFN